MAATIIARKATTKLALMGRGGRNRGNAGPKVGPATPVATAAASPKVLRAATSDPPEQTMTFDSPAPEQGPEVSHDVVAGDNETNVPAARSSKPAPDANKATPHRAHGSASDHAGAGPQSMNDSPSHAAAGRSAKSAA